jgi:DNA-binding NarL/FixJ family response regulator
VDDSRIERELIEAQAAVASAREATRRRQAAVMQARAAGWSKYRIAKVLGVGAPTVYSIISAADRGEN